MAGTDKKKIDALKALEEKQTQIDNQNEERIDNNLEETQETQEYIEPTPSKKERFNEIDGWRLLEADELPYKGVFMPAEWNLFYKCPEVGDVANFATIDENDRQKIMKAVSDLVRKCFKIVNNETEKEVSTKEINSGEKLFYFLRLREFYLNDKPIVFQTFSAELEKIVEVNFVSDSLVFDEPKQKLLECFDGRHFNFKMPDSKEVIRFMIPTLGIEEKIFNYMIGTYKKLQKDENNKKDLDAYNKQFLLFAPYLFETGTEIVETLKAKFNNIKRNEALYKYYLEIILQLTPLLSNKDYIKFMVTDEDDNEIMEESLMRFPGGWRKMFVNTESSSDLF